MALVNALSLVIVSFLIFYEAFRRLQNPEPVKAGLMIWVAAAGVVMNGVIAALLYRSGGDVNIRSAFLHEVGDTVSVSFGIFSRHPVQTQAPEVVSHFVHKFAGSFQAFLNYGNHLAGWIFIW